MNKVLPNIYSVLPRLSSCYTYNMLEFLNTFNYYSTLILPWFFVGIVISFLLNKYVDHRYLKKLSGKVNFKKIIFSQLVGMISPLSILSFLPVARELTSWGVNPGLLLSFFIAERAYDLQSFFIISGLFGVKFAFLNALAIFLSLLVSAFFVRNTEVQFKTNKHEKGNHFWLRQVKLLLIVIIGIAFGTLIRVFVPEQLVINSASGYISGFVSAVILGFSLYLGPIVGNYPVAKAFSDLGMSNLGTFAFLTISPILNFVVILLFGAAVGYKTALRTIFFYVLIATCMTFLFSAFL